MALQYSVAVRNAQLDAVETTAGIDGILKVWSGAAPAACATADSGATLVTITLPTDWMAAASSASKAKSGTWSDTSADATGTAGHFRLYASDGTTCHVQGEITITGGGGVMTVDSLSVTAGQTFTVTGFTLAAGNA